MFVVPLRPVDYNRDLHTCPACRTTLQLDVAKRRGWFYVVTRCRCHIYSTEAGPYTQTGAVRERRRMYAGLEPRECAVVLPEPNTRNIYWNSANGRWTVQIRRNGRRYQANCKTREEALERRDAMLAEVA